MLDADLRRGWRASSVCLVDFNRGIAIGGELGRMLTWQVEILWPGTAVVPLRPDQSVIYTASSYVVSGWFNHVESDLRIIESTGDVDLFLERPRESDDRMPRYIGPSLYSVSFTALSIVC